MLDWLELLWLLLELVETELLLLISSIERIDNLSSDRGPGKTRSPV